MCGSLNNPPPVAPPPLGRPLKSAAAAADDDDAKTVDVSAKGMTSKAVADACEAKGINVRVIDDKTVGLSFGESITKSDVETLVSTEGGEEKEHRPGWPGWTQPAVSCRRRSFNFVGCFLSTRNRREMARFPSAQYSPINHVFGGSSQGGSGESTQCFSSTGSSKLVPATAALLCTVSSEQYLCAPETPNLTPGPPRPSPLPLYPLSILLPQLEGFGVSASALDSAASGANLGFSDDLVRTSEYMTHPVFNTHHSEVGTYTERET